MGRIDTRLRSLEAVHREHALDEAAALIVSTLEAFAPAEVEALFYPAWDGVFHDPSRWTETERRGISRWLESGVDGDLTGYLAQIALSDDPDAIRGAQAQVIEAARPTVEGRVEWWSHSAAGRVWFKAEEDERRRLGR